MGWIYCLKFPNGKSYIGLTKISPAKRLAKHRYTAAKEPRKTFTLYRAWRKYGEPEMTVLLECPDDQMPAKEIMFIAQYNTTRPYGYNSAPGGRVNFMDETTRAKMSRVRKGMKFSDEHKRNLSLAHKGLPSPKKGVPMSAEQREKLKAAWKLRRIKFPITQETRDKMSVANRRPMSEVGKQKIKAARIKYWADRRAATVQERQ